MDRKNSGLKIGNPLFHKALQQETQSIPPIWMMRQAGRYHWHYQNLRKKHSFEELCKNPDLAAEVAWGPVSDFDFDLAILFSDILFPLDCLGLGLEYTDKGPRLQRFLNEENIDHLVAIDEAVEGMQFQKLAVQKTREKLPIHKSLIGFVGGIWTLFCYGIEGKHAGNLIHPKQSIHVRKKFFTMMDFFLKENIRYQLEGGAEVVMVLDTAAGALSPQEFASIIIPSLRSLTAAYPGKLGYYCKEGTESQIAMLQEIPGLAGVGFDHRIDLPTQLRKKTRGFIQGNFDQCLLFRDKANFATSLEEYLEPLQTLTPEERQGWICGLGHGILPKTPEENVRYFVETVRKVFA
ncbi:MAG: uroporphyrinogen decarboxylase family protein [Spirochaetota bacterium]